MSFFPYAIHPDCREAALFLDFMHRHEGFEPRIRKEAGNCLKEGCVMMNLVISPGISLILDKLVSSSREGCLLCQDSTAEDHSGERNTQ